jgi:hypothetical protein
MIRRRYSFSVKRLPALVVALGVLSSGCLVAGVYKEPGPGSETPADLRGASIGAGRGPTRGAMPLTGCSTSALQLIELVNEYRAANGLPAIPASLSLCTVAAAHARDLADHAPHAQPGCNLHSWSDKGDWTACCYTRDHAQASCMWNKPRQLTGYSGNGYENAASGVASPEEALGTWRSSPAHDAVILSRDAWRSHPWRAIGAEVYGGFALLWFGEEADPAR